jgi:hypothetical protein
LHDRRPHGRLAGVRHAVAIGITAVALSLPAAAAQAGSSSYFSPQNRVISRASLAGVTPRSSWPTIRRAWGGDPSSGSAANPGWGRTIAVWGTPGIFSPTVAWAAWAGSVGARPIRFAVDLEVAEGLGYPLRTRYGDRAGTPARTFRRHWPRAERMPSDPDWTFYLVDSSYQGWRLVFLFRGGRLKHVELARNDFINACLRKTCTRGFPPR